MASQGIGSQIGRETSMQIGVVKEVKDREYRVALTPSGAASLIAAGHGVKVQHEAGVEAGFSDDAYVQAGARMVSAEQAWQSELFTTVHIFLLNGEIELNRYRKSFIQKML